MERPYRLDRLARTMGVHTMTAWKWTRRDMIRGANLGRGRGRGVWLSREEALEAAALFLLRKHGVPLQRLRPVVRALRATGKSGGDFLALGSDGRNVLFDGAGDHVPLRNATGQGFFFAFDLRKLREEAAAVLDELEAEALKRAGAPA